MHMRSLLLPVRATAAGRVTTAATRLLVAGLLITVGIVHLALAPQYLPGAAYIGILFYAICVATWLVAVTVLFGVRGGYALGALVAGGAAAGLVLASTVGLPAFRDSLSAPWAWLSLALEVGLVAVYLVLLAVRRNLALAPSP